MDLHSKLRSAPCHCTGQARGTSKPFKLRTNDENFVLLKDDFAAHKQFTGRASDNSAAPSAVMEYIIINDEFQAHGYGRGKFFVFRPFYGRRSSPCALRRRGGDKPWDCTERRQCGTQKLQRHRLKERSPIRHAPQRPARNVIPSGGSTCGACGRVPEINFKIGIFGKFLASRRLYGAAPQQRLTTCSLPPS